ncbi:sterol O-acyltransferase 1-like isoform X2 [Xenia sp. Carnegie-2017]|nr:sterol O-acyltransferase 1-like isoform X2 [Xenia sp. Carnegie-2017]
MDEMKQQNLKTKAENVKKKLLRQFQDSFESSMDDLFQDFLRENVGSVGQTTRNGGIVDQSTRNSMESRKVFKPQQSVLTVLLEVSHIRTIYNIFVAILIVFSFNTLVYDYIDHGRFVIDISILTWAFGNVPVVLLTWIAMQVQLLSAYPLFQAWISTRSPSSKVVDFIWLGILIAYVVFLICFPINVIYAHDLPPVSRIIILMEQVRFYMKLHAFVREVAPRVLASSSSDKKNSDNEQSEDEDNEDACKEDRNIPGFSQFLYFLFAPTLIYRDSYPQTSKIRWHYVVTNFLQVLGCVFYTYYIFVRFCVPVFRDMGNNPPNLKKVVLSIFNTMLPGTLVLVLGFFCILHSWLNAFAEMLKFADRMFYKDWWNSTSYANYYRTWNVVVHDWLYAYCFRDFHWMFRRNRNIAMIITFLISALVHEYVLIISFNFFFPALFVSFFGFGVSFVFLKPRKGKNVSPGWNIFMWVTLIFGSGMLMVLYSIEWFAVQNNPKSNDSLREILVPRSWAFISNSSVF